MVSSLVHLKTDASGAVGLNAYPTVHLLKDCLNTMDLNAYMAYICLYLSEYLKDLLDCAWIAPTPWSIGPNQWLLLASVPTRRVHRSTWPWEAQLNALDQTCSPRGDLAGGCASQCFHGLLSESDPHFSGENRSEKEEL